jgi:hypothetical protein
MTAAIVTLIIFSLAIGSKSETSPDDEKILSVCKDFANNNLDGQSLSDAMDECWSCCANETDKTKQLIGYNVSNGECICTHVLNLPTCTQECLLMNEDHQLAMEMLNLPNYCI